MISQCERQLAYLVSVTSNLFSYGLPSANARLHDKAMDDNSQLSIEQRYPDFIIFSRVIFLARITNQIASVSEEHVSFVSKISERYCLT